MTEIKLSEKTRAWLAQYAKKEGRLNVYVCESKARHRTVTRNRETGTTPFMIGCPRCSGAMARSQVYDVPPLEEAAARSIGTEFQWIRPSVEELDAYIEWSRSGKGNESHPDMPTDDDWWRNIREQTLEHIRKGGLILVPTGDDRWRS